MLRKTIAIIDDDPLIAEYLATVLEPYGHSCTYYSSAESFLYSNPVALSFSCLLIDWKLPGISGLNLIKQLKTWVYCPPIMMITGLQAENDLALALHAGADDYITKPINKTIFLARFCALLRRRYTGYNDQMTPTNIALDRHKQELHTLTGERISFSQKEFLILECLIIKMGEPVKREILFKSTNNMETSNLKSQRLDLAICRLRKKLKTLESVNIVIKSIYGVGYTLLVE